MTMTPAGCRDPLEGIIVATLSILGLRVKTLDFGLDDSDVLLRRYPPGALSWSSGFFGLDGVFGDKLDAS
jgi:hypothetical protein